MNNNKNLIKTLTFLNSLNKKFERDKLRIFSSQRIHKTKFNFFRFLISNKEFKKLPYCDLLINYFIKSERIYPGSSHFLSKYIVGLYFKNTDLFENIKQIENNLDNINKYFQQISSEDSFKLIKNVLQFSGPNCSISCNASDSKEIIVKKSKNPVFNISIHEDFSGIYFSKSKSKTQSYLISVLDAYIERESEIIPLLDKAKENKVPLIFFCRGISENAVRSLKNIILRNNIHILPYIIKFDNEDPFKMKDLSSVLNCEMVNAESGDGIYKDSVRKSIIKLLKTENDKIEVFNPNVSLNNSINEKLKDCKDLSLRKYLFLRKSRINPNNVNILIPKSKIEMLSEIKYLILCYNSIVIHGLYTLNETIYSKKSINTTKILGNKLKETLDSIGYIILQNKRESE